MSRILWWSRRRSWRPPSQAGVSVGDRDSTRIWWSPQRDAAARRRVDDANAERRKKGPRIGMNWFFQEAEARARSRLFFTLGNEGRKKLVQAFPHADLNRLPFREFVQNCVYAFKVEANVIMERIKLYNSLYMEANESFLSFNSRL